MLTNNVLVTGCDKGIGLEFIKQLAPQTKRLFAGCLHPGEASEVQKVSEVHPHVVILHIDVTDNKTIQKAVLEILASVGDEGLNLLINNAAVLHFMNSIETLTAQSMATTYDVNAIGPAMVMKACLPLLRQAASLLTSSEKSIKRASIVNISSWFSSMESARGEKIFYSYRSSKIAVNMLAKNLSIELEGDNVLVVNMCPGWVRTDMGGEDAPTTTQESVGAILDVVSGLDDRSGLFYSSAGGELPW